MTPQNKNSTLTTKDVDDFCMTVLTCESDVFNSHVKIGKYWKESAYDKVLSMNPATVGDLDIPVTYINPPFAVLHFKCWLKAVQLDHLSSESVSSNYERVERQVDLFKPNVSIDLRVLERYFLDYDGKTVESYPDFISYLNGEVITINPIEMAKRLIDKFA